MECTMAVIFGTRREVNCHFSAIGQIFLHSNYEIFYSTGARRPFQEKPSHLGSWVLTPLRMLVPSVIKNYREISELVW